MNEPVRVIRHAVLCPGAGALPAALAAGPVLASAADVVHAARAAAALRRLFAVLLGITLLITSCHDPVSPALPAEDEAGEPGSSIEETELSVPGFIVIPGPHYPGGIVEAFAPRLLESDSARLVLTGPDGHVYQEVEGIITDLEGIEAHWYFVIGIDSWAAPGAYDLELVHLFQGEVLFSQNYDLPLISREYERQVIPLNSRLTDIRTDESPERMEQSRRLSELLLRVDPASRYIAQDQRRRLPLDSIYHTSGFGVRRIYEYSDGSRASSIHNGLDFRAAVGESVFSPLSGLVVMAEFRLVTGYTVVLEHLPGVYSLYYHLDDLAVSPEEEVLPGDVLGGAGRTGLATGSHLHWEIRIGGKAVDPEEFMSSVLLDRERLLQVLSGHNT